MSSRKGGRGGRNPKDLPRDQQVSRKVSWLLRHGAGQEGLKLGDGGYVNVRDALNTRALKTLSITFPELRDIVITNDKQRFSMIHISSLGKATDACSQPIEGKESKDFDAIPESDEPADYLIRANQGHSIKVDTEGLLKPITVEVGNVPDTVVHGTDDAAWRLILKSGGLRKMTRNHIHFASGLPVGFKALNTKDSEATAEERESPPVISGMRKSSTVLIYVDIRAAMEAGIKFYLSDNGVVLTEGDDKGILGSEFFKRVESRKSGGGVIMENGIVPEGTEVDIEQWEKEVGSGKRGGKHGRGRGGRGGGRGDRGTGKERANDDSQDLLAGM